MDIETKLKENLDRYIAEGEKGLPSGITRVQKLLRIGYNQAVHTIEKGIEEGVLQNCDERPWLHFIK